MVRFPRLVVAIALALPVVACPTIVLGQNVVVGTPFNNVGDSFYENYGASGSWSNGNAFFNWGGGGAVPPFGGYDPNADARFGLNVGGLNLNFTAGQGSSRFSSSQTPMVTVPNGGYGSIFSGTVTPFVTGFVPVVGADGGIYGGGSTMLEDRWSRLQAGERPTPLKPEAQNVRQASFADRASDLHQPTNSLPSSRSSAEVATAGVAAQRAAYLAEASRESLVGNERFRQALERAEGALTDGKAKLAKAYMDQALRYATDDDQRREVQARLQAASAGAP
ncbi:MAG TPA: hypothetical protein VGN57_02880 [Pirellulaceae bacterium]|jgi:hypothetical protein|nr:hypothetical protein [Pirellulaceae bacterium]